MLPRQTINWIRSGDHKKGALGVLYYVANHYWQTKLEEVKNKNEPNEAIKSFDVRLVYRADHILDLMKVNLNKMSESRSNWWIILSLYDDPSPMG